MADCKKDRLRGKRRLLRVRRALKNTRTSELFRVSIHRTLKHISAQLINDEEGITVLSSSTLQHKIEGDKKMQARYVGKELARLAKEKGVHSVRIDRGGRRYHGRIKELVEGIREGGIQV